MRKILFRGKRKDNGEWVYGDLFNNYNDKKFIGELIISDYKGSACDRYEIGTSIAECIPSTVGQYTGLTDKNGKKIFEGDIVSHYINWLGKRVNAVVKYDIKAASWACDVFNNDKKSAFLADWVDRNGCVVIGNIHDNPELLKGGDENDI